MTTDFFDIYLNKELTSQMEVYQFLAKKLSEENSLTVSDIVTKFLRREDIGNIQIADKTIMPHFDERGLRNKIIILRTHQAIPQWSEQLQNIQLIIALIIDSEANRQDKEEFQNFVKKFMNADFIRRLLTDDKSQIESLILG